MALDPDGTVTLVEGGADLHPMVAPRRLGAPVGTGEGRGRRSRHSIHGRDLDRGAPESRGRVQRREPGEGHDRREALGRSLEGSGTKVVVVAGGRGRALGVQSRDVMVHRSRRAGEGCAIGQVRPCTMSRHEPLYPSTATPAGAGAQMSFRGDNLNDPGARVGRPGS